MSIDMKILKLNKGEQAFKNRYIQGGQTFLQRPMTYAQYMEYADQGKVIRGLYEHYHITENDEKSNIRTIEHIQDKDNVFVSFHPRYSYPLMHNHAFVEIIYVYAGKCRHFVEKEQIDMKEGDICILAPNTIHALSVTNDDTFIFNIMVSREVFDQSFMELLRGGNIIKEFFDNLFYKKELVSPYVIYPTGTDMRIRMIAECMYDETKNKKYGYKRYLTYYVSELFINLIRNYEMFAIVTSPTGANSNEHVISVLGYLSMNYKTTNLNETADFFGYTPNYLGRMLHKYTGRTYREIISEYQLENAVKLIETTNLSVTEIAQEIGCFDSSHFTKKFKNYFGITPSTYRKQLQKKES